MCVCMEFKVKKIRHATDILAKGESEHYNDHQMDLKGNNLKEVWGGGGVGLQLNSEAR